MDGLDRPGDWGEHADEGRHPYLASGAQGFRYVLTSTKAIKTLDDMKAIEDPDT